MHPLLVDGAAIEARWWPGANRSAPPLVLLHEGLGAVSLWRDFPAALAARSGRRVFAYSRRGYGRSAPRGAPLEPDFMHVEAQRHLPRVLDAAGIARAVLVGHSDGGSIALLAAAAWPERVEALVLAAPHVFVEDVTIASIARMREAYATGDLRARLARHHVHVDEAFSGWADVWLDPRFRNWNIEGALSGVHCDTLVLQGTEDVYGTPAQVAAIERAVPGHVTTVLIQNCGHSPHRDQPATVLERIAAFIAGLHGLDT